MELVSLLESLEEGMAGVRGWKGGERVAGRRDEARRGERAECGVRRQARRGGSPVGCCGGCRSRSRGGGTGAGVGVGAALGAGSKPGLACVSYSGSLFEPQEALI